MADWALGDILAWLGSLGLDDLASLLVGYEITGRDVIAWDRAALGITPPAFPTSRSFTDGLQRSWA